MLSHFLKIKCILSVKRIPGQCNRHEWRARVPVIVNEIDYLVCFPARTRRGAPLAVRVVNKVFTSIGQYVSSGFVSR